MSIKSKRIDNSQALGFTLVEVLIALLVLAVGLLGLAGLQATTLRNNQSAYFRSQAVQLGYDMADRMRSNSANTSNLAGSTYVTIALGSAAEQADCATVSTSCTSTDMAENDLYLWNLDLTRSLPLGQGSITVNAGARVFTVTVNWDDNRSGAIDNSDPNFQTSFQP